jgi:type II secretory pathway pseudopilin PulG
VELVLVVALLGLLATLGISRIQFFTPPPEGVLQKALLHAQGEARKNLATHRIRTKEGALVLEISTGALWEPRPLPWKTPGTWGLKEDACYAYPDGSFSPVIFFWGEEKKRVFFITVTGQVVPGESGK